MPTNNTFTGNLGKIIENLMRPSNAMNTTIDNALKSAKGEDNFDPIGSFSKGFQNKIKTSGTDIIDDIVGSQTENAGNPEKIVRGTAGLMIDIFADPTTYMGIGGMTKTGEALKMADGLARAGKTIDETSNLAKAIKGIAPEASVLGKTLAEQGARGQRALITIGGNSLLGSKVDAAALGLTETALNYAKNMPLIRDAIQGAKSLFNTKTGLPEFDNAIEKYHGNINLYTEDIFKTIDAIGKKLKPFSKEERATVTDAMMKGSIDSLPKGLQEVANMSTELYNKMAKVEVEKGALKATIDKYIPGVRTEEAVKMAREFGIKSGMSTKDIDSSLDFAKHKLLTKEMSPSEANSVIKLVVGNKLRPDQIQNEIIQALSPEAVSALEGIQLQARSLGKTKVGDYFHTDPQLLAATRGVKSARAVAAKDFYQQIKQFGVDDAKIKSNVGMDMIGHRTVSIPELQGKWFPRDLADALERSHGAMTSNKTMNELVGGYKKLINFWKRWTLTVFPEYHTRNIVGNWWNNYLVSGMSSPEYYMKAALVASRKGDGLLIKATGEKLTNEQIIHEMKLNNALQGGFIGTESAESMANKLKGPSLNPLDENFGLIRGGRFVGEKIENNAKIAQYMFSRAKGMSPEDAAWAVKKATFDYGDLTDFEKNYMRLVFPFYSWSRKNIPLQVKSLIMQPEKFARIGKVKSEIEGAAGTNNTDLTWMPGWMKESLPVILDKLPEAQRYKIMLLMSWLPAGDVAKIIPEDAKPMTAVQHATDFAVSQLEPISKEFIQQFVAKKDFFLDKPIQDYPGEVESILGIDMDSRLKHALKSFRILNFVDQLNPGGVFGTKGGEKSWTGAKRRIVDLPMKERLIKSGLGIKLYPYDVTQSKRFAVAKITAEIKGLEVQKKKAMKDGDTTNIAKIINRITELNKKKVGG